MLIFTTIMCHISIRQPAVFIFITTSETQHALVVHIVGNDNILI